MTHLLLLLVFIILLPTTIQAQGAAYAGRGHAGVADASDAFAGLWNPAALAFLPNREIVYQRSRWLPNLADDMVYQHLGNRHNIPAIGTFGGHIIYLNLGKYERMDESGDHLGTFHSYMWAITASFGAQVSSFSSMGFNVNLIRQNLSESGLDDEEGKDKSTDFSFDLGYYRRKLLLSGLDMGIAIRNMGPSIASIDEYRPDPRTMEFALGLKWSIIKRERSGIALFYDLNKLLVASYPSVDHDGDGYIGGYDEDGNLNPGGEYSRDGKREQAHTDPWYLALFTSWFDDWKYGGDVDRNGDGIINADDPSTERDENEIGNQDEFSLRDEMRTITPHAGVEVRFLTHYTVRAGMMHDRIGKVREYTLGAGIHFRAFRFDFAYLYGGESRIGGPMPLFITGSSTLFSMNLVF